MSEDNNEPKEERKLEPYHYEAMIRAEVEKRVAAEKEKTGTQNIVPRPFQEPQSQPLYPPSHYESPPPYLAQQPQSGFPVPGQQSQPQPYYQTPQQPQQYQSGPIPYPLQYQQPQQQPYYQPQPQQQPYYQQPPAQQPVINVVVQNTNVNRNSVRGGYYGRAAHGHIGCFNVCYFLFIGWALGMTWGFVGLCVLPFDRRAADAIFKQAFFLAFLA